MALDAKRLYQRNLLLGMGVSLLLAACGALLIGITDDEPQADVNIVVARGGESHGEARRAGGGKSPGTVRSVMAPQRLKIGFRFRVIADRAERESGPERPEYTPGTHYSNFQPVGSATLDDGSPEFDDREPDLDYGLPQSCFVFPLPDVPFRYQDKAKIPKRKQDRDARIIFRTPVLWPQNRRAKHQDRGRAVVQLTITEDCHIEGMKVIEDVPPKCGFAGALEEALYGAWVLPAIVNGTEVRSTITITYWFVTDFSGTGRLIQPRVETTPGITVRYPGAR